ncbi:MAG: WD40 repeat domain-containing protein [Candidatus Hydrogenedentes bacterium]|nr:WD40 repeat domain-containing protein [Candidatus Hydrogenedentota bacterium]
MIFELARDFTDALAAMPREHPKRRTLALFEEAIRRDIHFIDRHPTTMFQCMWNLCWWYDCPDAYLHLVLPPEVPCEEPRDKPCMHGLLERWAASFRATGINRIWIRSLRPLLPKLGSGQIAFLRLGSDQMFDVVCAAFHPDCRKVIVGGIRTVEIWNVVSCHRRAVSGPVMVKALAPSPDGSRAAVLEQFGSLAVCDTDDCRLLFRTRFTEDAVYCVAWSHDGRWVAAGDGGWEGCIYLWETEDWQSIARSCVGEGGITGIAFSPDSGKAAAVSWDGDLRILEVPSLRLIATLSRAADGSTFLLERPANCISWAPDGRRIAVGYSDCTIRIWDTESKSESLTLIGHTADVRGVDWLSDSRRIVSGSLDGTVRLWDALDGVLLNTFHGHESSVIAVKASHDISVASASEDGTIRIWDPNVLVVGTALQGHAKGIKQIIASHDGTRVVTLGYDDSLRMWSAASGTQMMVMQGKYHGAEFSTDGRILMARVNESTMYWDTQTGESIDLKINEWLGAEGTGSTIRQKFLFEKDTILLNDEERKTPSAWFSRAPRSIPLSDDCTWAACLGSYFTILRLEGAEDAPKMFPTESTGPRVGLREIEREPVS